MTLEVKVRCKSRDQDRRHESIIYAPKVDLFDIRGRPERTGTGEGKHYGLFEASEIGARIVGKIRRLLARRDGDAVDDEPDALAYAQAEAVQLPMSLVEPVPRTSASRRRCAFIDGFSLHTDSA